MTAWSTTYLRVGNLKIENKFPSQGSQKSKENWRPKQTHKMHINVSLYKWLLQKATLFMPHIWGASVNLRNMPQNTESNAQNVQSCIVFPGMSCIWDFINSWCYLIYQSSVIFCSHIILTWSTKKMLWFCLLGLFVCFFFFFCLFDLITHM